MFDETVLREISLSDGSSKLIFKHIYIYIFRLVLYLFHSIVFYVLRLDFTTFFERISSFRREIMKTVLFLFPV